MLILRRHFPVFPLDAPIDVIWCHPMPSNVTYCRAMLYPKLFDVRVDAPLDWVILGDGAQLFGAPSDIAFDGIGCSIF